VLDGDIIKVNMKTPNTEEVLGSTPDSWSSAREELDLEVIHTLQSTPLTQSAQSLLQTGFGVPDD